MFPFLYRQGLAAIVLSVSSMAASGWTSDYAGAGKQATQEKKDLLIDFTGSDWCAWCIKLRKEVFEKEPFDTGVKDQYVLIELDYPKDKTRLAAGVAEQNEGLLKKYPIKGYPTVLLCDAEGRPFAATGYQPGGPEAYLKHLETLQAKKAARDKGFEEAAGKSGVEKAKQLIATLDALELEPDMIQNWYGDIAEQIKAADPADETGFAKKGAVDAAFASYMEKLNELRSKQDLEGVAKLVEETLANPLVQGDTRAQVYGHYAGTLAYAGKKDEAIALLKKAVTDVGEGAKKEELQKFIELLEKEKAGVPPTPRKEAE